MTYTPLVSVVVVSDYAADPDSARHDLLRTLRALRLQEYSGRVEYLLADTAPAIEALPPGMREELPGLRFVAGRIDSAEALKNDGVAESRGDVVVVLDADCDPAPGWLAAAVDALATGTHAAVSGKTLYRQRQLLPRLCALLTRAYVDPGSSSTEALSLSGNNAAFRRDAILRCPFPDTAGPFAGRIHTQRFRDGGYRIGFSDRMLAFHAYDGWRIERDIRRHLGRTCIHSRLVEPNLPFASVARWGVLAIPFFLAARTVHDWLICLRVRSRYGVRWYEVPAALVFAVAVRGFELPGMIDAVLNRPVPNTHYR
jgi:glycosyltransferase involved in cell wall biosynthesis